MILENNESSDAQNTKKDHNKNETIDILSPNKSTGTHAITPNNKITIKRGKQSNVGGNTINPDNSQRTTHVAFKENAFLWAFKGKVLSQEDYVINVDLVDELKIENKKNAQEESKYDNDSNGLSIQRRSSATCKNIYNFFRND